MYYQQSSKSIIWKVVLVTIGNLLGMTLRLKSGISLHSVRYGRASFSFVYAARCKTFGYKLWMSATKFYKKIADSNNPPLYSMYICGYTAYKLKHKLIWNFCVSFIVSVISVYLMNILMIIEGLNCVIRNCKYSWKAGLLRHTTFNFQKVRKRILNNW